mmetsp:Transcript_12152/g.35248  ORF Transcript_12152/g.35248 Transcript_12152/m.35248 type:complete len:269 (+) Transcript_12152:857-1663(+)
MQRNCRRRSRHGHQPRRLGVGVQYKMGCQRRLGKYARRLLDNFVGECQHLPTNPVRRQRPSNRVPEWHRRTLLGIARQCGHDHRFWDLRLPKPSIHRCVRQQYDIARLHITRNMAGGSMPAIFEQRRIRAVLVPDVRHRKRAVDRHAAIPTWGDQQCRHEAGILQQYDIKCHREWHPNLDRSKRAERVLRTLVRGWKYSFGTEGHDDGGGQSRSLQRVFVRNRFGVSVAIVRIRNIGAATSVCATGQLRMRFPTLACAHILSICDCTY